MDFQKKTLTVVEVVVFDARKGQGEGVHGGPAVGPAVDLALGGRRRVQRRGGVFPLGPGPRRHQPRLWESEMATTKENLQV